MGEYAREEQHTNHSSANTYGARSIDPTRHVSRDQQAPAQMVGPKTEIDSKIDDATDRSTLVNMIFGAADLGFEAISDAISSVGEVIVVPEKQEATPIRDLLVTAAEVVMVTLASGYGAWVARALTAKLSVALASNAVKESIKAAAKAAASAAFHAPSSKQFSAAGPTHAFLELLRENRRSVHAQFLQEWPSVATHLRKLSAVQLQSAADAATDDASLLFNDAKRSMLVEWANYIAKSVHGGMTWDHTAGPHGRKGSVPLQGATGGPTEPGAAHDPTRSNVDPARFLWGVDTDSPRNEGDYYGVLQVHVWDDGTLVDLPDYGMRLDNVGPAVRDELAKLGGLLRNLPLNKAVKVYARDPDNAVFPKPKYGFLITADNYIRQSYNKATDNVNVAERVQAMNIRALHAG